jgi:hypothetical protein
MSGCEHCSHPMWAGIKCSQCGRWYDECGTCGKRGILPCEECMIVLPQGYQPHEIPADYIGSLFLEGQMCAAVEAERKRILAILDQLHERAAGSHNYYAFAARIIREGGKA